MRNSCGFFIVQHTCLFCGTAQRGCRFHALMGEKESPAIICLPLPPLTCVSVNDSCGKCMMPFSLPSV